MNREDFKIVPNFYTTSSLTMILHKSKIIESVEVFKNYKTVEVKSDKEEGKPVKLKTSKEKRTPQEIASECERLIKKHMENVHQL